MFRARTAALALTIALGAMGCTSAPTEENPPTVGKTILNYPWDRVKDLADVVGFDLYCGQGALAHVQMTKLAQIGLGTFDGAILRYHNRAIGILDEIRAEAGLPLYYFTCYDRGITNVANDRFEEKYGDLADYGEVHYNLTDVNDRGFYEVGGHLALFVGIGLSVDLFQAFDFFTGFFFIDVGHDDYRNGMRPRTENPRYRGPGSTPISSPETTKA